MFRPRRNVDRRGAGDDRGEAVVGGDAAAGTGPTFAVVRRGYDTLQVDQHLAWLDAAPEPGEAEAYMEADRIVANARRLASEIALEAAQCHREAEAERRRAAVAAEKAQTALDLARIEAEQLLAEARARAADLIGSSSPA